VDALEISARNLMLCRQVSFDRSNPESPYTLVNVLTQIALPTPSQSFLAQPINLYVEYFGPPGFYEVWIDMVALGYDVYGEPTEVTSYGPFVLELIAGRYVNSRFYCLRYVPFPSGGVYEFQLRVAGVFEPLATQSLFVED
jgi:hypothetical protein